MNKKGLLFITIFSVVFLLFVSLFLICLFSLIQFYRFEEETVSESNFHEYRLLRYDSKTDEMSHGIVKNSEYLKRNEYKSFKDNRGVHTLISKFGTNEYRCTGSCSCESFFRRSSVSTSMAKGMYVLLAAFSTIGAINLAKYHFQDECEKNMEDVCMEHVITSEVDGCEELGKGNFGDALSDDEFMSEFMCEGQCQIRGGRMTKEEADECKVIGKAMTFSNKFTLMKNTLKMFIGGCVKLKTEAVIKEITAENAAKRFIWSNLHPYCKEHSQEEFEIGKGEKKKKVWYASHCVGHRGGKNRTVVCKRIDEDDDETKNESDE